MTTKAQYIEEYNKNNKGYDITGVNWVTDTELEAMKEYSHPINNHSLYEVYHKPSENKVRAWNELIERYEPRKIIQVQGGPFSFSVTLVAENGDILYITKLNNCLYATKPKKGAK